jgi:hypothetical protein
MALSIQGQHLRELACNYCVRSMVAAGLVPQSMSGVTICRHVCTHLRHSPQAIIFPVDGELAVVASKENHLHRCRVPTVTTM